jgi:hypothetical protein
MLRNRWGGCHLCMTSFVLSNGRSFSPINSVASLCSPTCRLVLVLFMTIPLLLVSAKETPSLMTMVGEWRYPDSKMNGASMSDGATLNASGERSAQSIAYQSVFTTADSMSKVIAYYKNKLSSPVSSEKEGALNELISNSGRSVKFHEDSEGRPMEVQVVLVNTVNSSTTLVVTRAAMESETHIAWTRYVRL